MRKSQKHKIVRTGGQRIAFTNTTKIPDSEIREAIKFCAKEIDIRREKKNRNCEAQCRAFGGWLARQWKESIEAA